jgi:serine/threonine protein kinase/WD40 repeat protein
MSELESAPDLLSNLAHAFAERYRRGERPALGEYTEQYPELATQIRELFPALVMMEQFGSVAGEAPAGNAACGTTAPKQLGEYRILREIGRGGMGIVFEAVQESLGRHVALKVLPLHHLMGATHLERFEREAKAAARLHHTNIVPVFGIGVHEGVHFYAMQFIQGQALDTVLEEVRVLRSGGKLPSHQPLTVSIAQRLVTEVPCGPEATAPPTGVTSNAASGSVSIGGASELTGPSEVQYFRGVARVGVQVAEALAYAHRQGIVHRDIKPSNVLLDTQAVAWITDFGLVKDEGGSNLTSPGDIVGTIRYMAPERFQEQGDTRCDIYSLGVTLYELLTLKPAFAGERRAELIDRVRHEEPVRPRQIDPRIPRDLETVVLKAMAREPERRYAHADALAEDLRRFLSDRPVLARRSTPLERTWRWCRRNPSVAILTTSVIVLLAMLIVGLLVHNASLQEQLDRAERAERDRTDQLWDSYLANVRASRWSGRPGRRFEGLEWVRRAAALRADPSLRNEAIALLTLPDVRIVQQIRDAIPTDCAAIALDPDFEHYARSDLKGNISVRRVVDDVEVQHLDGPGTHAWRMKFSPDGRFLAALYDKNGRQRVWHWRGRRVILEAPIAGNLDFSPDSTLAAVGGHDGVAIHELVDGTVVKRMKAGQSSKWGQSCWFHPGGKLAAIDSRDPLELPIMEWATGKGVATLPGEPPTWHPAGTRLLLRGPKAMTVWDARTWTVQKVLTGPDGPSAHACFSPRDDLLATGDQYDSHLRVWNPITGRPQLALPGATGNPPQFSRNGERLAATREGTTLQIWEVVGNSVARVFSSPSPPNDTTWTMQFSPDGALLVTTGAGGMRLWDVARGLDVANLPSGMCSGAVFAPDARALFTRTTEGVVRWPIRVQKDAWHIGPPEQIAPLPQTGHTGTLVVAADGKLAANLRGEGTVLLFDPNDPSKSITLAGHIGSTNRLAASADGRWIACRSWWNQPDKLRVTDLRTGEVVRRFPIKSAGCEFSPDSRWMVTGGDACQIWQTGTWELERTIVSPSGLGNVTYAAFAPDGVTLAIAYENQVVRLVDARSGEELASLPSPELPPVDRLCFSPDGSLLACMVEGIGVQLWDLRKLHDQLGTLGLDWIVSAGRPMPAEAFRGESISVALQVNGKPPLMLRAPFDADEAQAQQTAWAEHLGVPVESANLTGMRLRLIPRGRYVPGKYPSARGAAEEAFYLGATEVTVGQFRQFVEETGYKTSGEKSGLGGGDDRVGRRPENIWSHERYAPSDRHPVTQVTWDDAMAYCDWLSRKTDGSYRLPTMEEWLWAALAGTPDQFHFGDSDGAADAHMWHKGNSGQQSHPVGEKKPNPWGLFDMYGNVWEHTYLWQRNGKLVDMATARTGPRSRDRIELPGGSFSDAIPRLEYFAWLTEPSVPYFHFGFRVALVGDLKAAAASRR